jgi:hypothetical protein
MAALFNLAALRAHEAPAVLSVGMPGQTGFVSPRLPSAPRSRLTSTWIVAPDGHLACRWRKASADDNPDPD